MKTYASLLTLSGLLMLGACDKEDPVQELEQEVITDVTLTFTELDANGNPTATTLSFTASDPEGVELGGNPEIETISGLEAGKSYRLSLDLFNGIANESITEEIEEEDAEHQFFFLGSAFDEAFSYVYEDEDADGNPVGLLGTVAVAANASGNSVIRVILRHDLDKSNASAQNPNWAEYEQAGGETDLDVSFPVQF
ncbi:hypothetical protein QWY31_08985 [Cytophagales bacterium LB-30]|uniref:Type 1 periplasmic binding fold superfamily protein n=1 Tax=Shiella aurantiaca TaxID=3058365 RepID=A0ABT8F5G8_9BACT|nr:hypothetical protein [Shiella aurantiaca]MDN4165635.1 hypothetical protein [Shiella aurantiaca]